MKTKEEKKEYHKGWYEKNKDKMKEYRNKHENKEYQKRYYQEHKSKLNKYGKEWRKKNKDKTKEWYENNKDKKKANQLKKRFGITLKDYNELLRKQGGTCAICRNKANDKALAVDHNHKIGKVRGLLCHYCNSTLGYFKEDISLFYKCIEYLKKHQD